MSFPPSEKTKKDMDRYTKLSLKLIDELRKEGKINPSHATDIKKIDEVMDYANDCVKSHNAFYMPLQKQYKEFSNDLKKHNITNEEILNIELACIFHNTFKAYAIMEFSLGVLLDGITYFAKKKPKERKVKGTESLGELKVILKKILPESDFFWDEIDVHFRNAIAHGSYFVKDGKMMYYSGKKFENLQKMTLQDLYDKSNRLNSMAISITGSVRKWNESPKVYDFSANDKIVPPE